MPDSTLSTLAQIKIKVRRLTRSLSTAQLSESDLEQYINTFVLYDFPEHLRLFNLKTTLSFYTQPFVDTYATNTSDPANPLYNFKNKYVTVNPPAYIAGYQALWVQSEDQFYGIYPKINSIQSIGVTGDGVTTSFSGNINTNVTGTSASGTNGVLILPGSVLFDSVDVSGLAITLIDYPILDGSGNQTSNIIGALGPVGQPINTLPSPYGQINYLTGDFNLTFTQTPADGAPINSQTVLTQPSIPQTIMFFDTKFVLRPVPDQAYKITVEAFVRPTELLEDFERPELSEWWQYIAYGCAKKIFEDRMDMESVQMILPEFRNQMNLINRRTIVQQTNQRTMTIYTDQAGAASSYSAGWFSGGGSF